MRKRCKVQWGLREVCMALIVAMLALGMFFSKGFTLLAHAESAAKVTATTANIRKSADASSEILGSTEKGKEISIVSQTTGADGKVWYQVYIDATTMGYIRSDLVKITDGSTPPTKTDNGASQAQDGQGDGAGEQPAYSVNVSQVEPAEGKIKGSDSVRVRSDATTNGNNIIMTANKGKKVTVIGTATADDGKEWYLVTLKDDGTEVTGFIRSDYVKVTGELVPAGAGGEAPAEPAETTEPEPEQAPEPKKPYEVELVAKESGDKVWYLKDYDNGKQYDILSFISANEQYSKLYLEEQNKVKAQKTIIIIMVLLLLAMAGAIGFLVFKMKDSADSAYFRQVEQETIRRRTAEKPRRAAPYTRAGQESAQQPQREQRASSSNASRPAGNQPQQGRRPASQSQRPAGSVQGRRPAGSGQNAAQPMQGNRRPATQSRHPLEEQGSEAPRPAVKRSVPPRQRPTGNQPQEGRRPAQQRPVTAPRPQERQERSENANAQDPAWRSKNFMQEDDEFEFAFLNKWEDEE